MNKKYEHRPDCESFEAKQFEEQCGDCQTDGHYLCKGCRHIAPFEEMQYFDNRMKHYPKQAQAEIDAEKLLSETEITAEDDFYFDEDGDPEFQRCSNCDGHNACEDFGCAYQQGN